MDTRGASRTDFRTLEPAQGSGLAMVGQSNRLREALLQCEVVATTDCTTLILGETGTGKELLARIIHDRSARRNHPFVPVNCAAVPIELLESELFGHERGAFTGAVARQLGRFEVAEKGTLFLDEVGDIPAQLQPKLLRVLQEREFQRLGSTQTIHTDVRLIAATHRNLSEMVGLGLFRADLYYRLAIFPITMPPLRERREDIPLLVRHFAEKYAQELNRRIEAISAEAMQELKQYSWPGNIRELQNFVQRSLILSRGPVLDFPIGELAPPNQEAAEPVTLREAERAHILRTLKKTGGQLTAAAALLGIPRTTLFYKLRRLGIATPRAAGRVRAAS
jgi:formate hydrogenlyase transcriptional activator